MNFRHILLVFGLLLGITVNGWAQNPPKVLIPSTPNYDVMDTTCYIPCGTLILPQGKVNINGGINVFIPTNRFTWALGIAHAWNYTRNVLKMPNKFSMDIWLGIAGDESQFGCIPSTVWAAGRGSAFQISWAAAYNGDGCYQMENGVAGGQWIGFGNEMQQHYPTRFVGASPAPYFAYSFERASLSMAYEFVKEMQWSRYKFGVDPYAIAVSAADPLALHKVFAAFHNNQTASFSSIPSFLYANRVALQTNACWPDFGGLGNASYLTKHGNFLSVLQGLNSHCNFPSGSQKFEDFNENIAWDTVAHYMDVIKPFYHEYSGAQWTSLVNIVKAKFITVSGSISTPIPFKQLGPVIDAIILGLPKEDPAKYSLAVWPGNWDSKLEGWGYLVPTGKIGYTAKEFCLGTSYTLKSIVDGGESTDISFKWYKNGNLTPYATTRDIIETPSAAGTNTYKLEMCNSKGCLSVGCDVSINVKDCNTCGMSLMATPLNTPCQNMKAGSISLTIGGATSFTVNYTGPTSGTFTGTGTTATIQNLPDGVYNIEVIKNGSPTCKAVATALIKYTTAQNVTLTGKVIDFSPKCQANLQADIVANPTPCLWRVKFWQDNYFFFPAVTVLIKPGGNKPGAYQTDIQDPSVGYEKKEGKAEFYASTGDNIDLDLTIVPTPGASMITAMNFEIYDANNLLVYSIKAPANSVSSSNINYHVATYTVKCPVPTGSPAYNFSWVNPITITGTTNIQSKGNTAVSQTTNDIYTIIATNKTNIQCTLSDTVLVRKDASCIPTCTPATETPAINTTSSTLSVCSPAKGAITMNALTQTGLQYQLYYDGGSGYVTSGSATAVPSSPSGITLSNLAAGKYKIRTATSIANLTAASTCYKESADMVVLINALPAAPTVSTPVTYCQNATATALTATGTSLKWYDVATLGTVLTSTPTPSTATAGSPAVSYWVSQTVATCEGPRAKIDVNVTALPAAPTVSTPVAYCQNATATALTATGTSLKWYDVATLGTILTSTPIPSTATAGSPAVSYWVSQTVATCEGPRAKIDINVTAAPAAPTVSTPVAYCQNATATALTATGTALKWYNVATLGTILTSTPIPSTGTAGSPAVSYWVSQTVATCEGPRAKIDVNVTAAPAAPTVSTPVIYCQNATATALTATGTSLKWYNVATLGTVLTSTPTPNTATAGSPAVSYWVSQTVATCEGPRAKIDINVNPLPNVSATASPSATVCAGTPVTLNGGGAKTYTWDNLVTDNTPFTPTVNKTYTVTGTDVNGCKNTATIDIALSSPPAAVITTTALGYCDITGASGITLTAQTVAGATYEWSKGGSVQGTAGTTNTYVNALAGNWTVKVSIGTCSATSSQVTVFTNPLPNVTASASPGNALCLNDMVTLKGSSTTSGVTYIWDNSVSDNLAFALDNAAKFKTYTVTATVTSTGCQAKNTVILTQKAPTVISVNPSGFTACKGENKSLAITATGEGTLTYQWLNGSTAVGTNNASLSLNPIQVADAGTYKVKVTGACGTLTSNDAIVVVNDAPVITKRPAKTSGCVGNTAALTVTANGANPTYQWTKSPSAISLGSTSVLNFNPLKASDAGIYTVTITNACGSVSDTASVATPANETPAVEITSDQARVCAGNTITLTATVTQGGGNSPLFTFKDGSGAIIGTAGQAGPMVTTAALTANQTYTVQMLSNSTCLAPGAVNPAISTPVDITVDAAPVNISAGNDQPICTTNYTLAASAAPAGATGKWTVQSGNGSFLDNTAYNTSVSNLDLGENTYTWTVTSGVCTPVSETVTITRAGKMTPPNAGLDIRVCEGSAVNLSAGILNTGETGKWTIKPASLTIINNTQPAANINNPVAGTYDVKWTISNGVCPDQADSLILLVDKAPSIASLAATTIPTCGTQVSLNANTPASGHGFWTVTSGSGSIALADSSNPAAIITGLSTGANTLTWIVKNGVCTPGTPATLTVNKVGNLTTPVITLDGNTVTGSINICKNKSYSFTANSPASDETGIWSSTSSNIGSLSGSNLNQNLTINSVGNATITWKIASSVSGCTDVNATVTLNISDVPAAPVTIKGVTEACQGASINQSIDDITDATSYIWTLNGNVQSSVTSSAQLTLGNTNPANVTVLATNGCGSGESLSKDITVNTSQTPVMGNLVINGNNGCLGTLVTITASASSAGTNPTFTFKADLPTTSPATYAYTPAGSENISVIVTRDMSITNGCFTKDTASAIAYVVVKDPVTPSIGGITPLNPAFCQGTVQKFTAVSPGNGTLQWYVKGVSVSGETGTTFSSNTLNDNDEVKVVLTSNETCTTSPTAYKSVIVKVNPVIASSVSIKDDNFTICKGAAITFTAIPGSDAGTTPKFQWLINGQKVGSPAASLTFDANALTDGSLVNVEITPDVTCPALIPASSAAKQVTVINSPIANAGPDLELDKVQDVTLTAFDNGAGYTYNWKALDNPLATLTPDVGITTTVSSKQVTTTYILTVSGGGGCPNDFDEVTISFNIKVKVPTGFSPNGDTFHETFDIPDLAYYPKASVVIFNQWGETVYKSPVPYQPWDGKRNGSEVGESTYYYIIEFNEPGVGTMTGYVTLIR